MVKKKHERTEEKKYKKEEFIYVVYKKVMICAHVKITWSGAHISILCRLGWRLAASFFAIVDFVLHFACLYAIASQPANKTTRKNNRIYTIKKHKTTVTAAILAAATPTATTIWQ